MKKIFFKSLLALCAVATPLAATTMALTSCTSQANYATTDAAKYYTSFLNENHGRWAGNSSNFKNVKNDGTGLSSTTLDAKYPLGTKIEKTVANYGSHHAYLWLLNEVTKNLGYTELNANFTRPAYGTVSSSGESKSITAVNGTTKYDINTSNSVICNTTTDHSLLYKTGVVTQPFLWNRSSTFNNIGSNLIVTINPDESKGVSSDPYDFFIVAHYDSTASGPNKASWGATDNATSVAMNLAILKHFSNEVNRKNLKTRLHVMFADAEEVGVLGTNAFVRQYLGSGSPLLNSSWGMINLDTIAGGDYMYIHSPDTKNNTGNTTPALRNMINSISKGIANDLGSNDYELQIHPQYVSNEYQEGETGDWSDHYPFYKLVNIPIAYVESTNFALKSKYNTFDGYSQTINKNAWLTKDYVPVEMVAKKSDTGQTIYELPDGYKLEDFILKGDIWHSDIDTPDWLATYIGENKIFKQLDATFQTLIKFLTSTTPHKIS